MSVIADAAYEQHCAENDEYAFLVEAELAINHTRICHAPPPLELAEPWRAPKAVIFTHRLRPSVEESALVAEIAYAPADRICEIIYVSRRGLRRRWYAGVPYDVFWGWTRADSLGKYYHAKIKGYYSSVVAPAPP